MPIISIPYQPASAQLMAAYRPIVFKVQASAVSQGGATVTVTGSMSHLPDDHISIVNYNGTFFTVGKRYTISGTGANDGDRTVTSIQQIGTTQVIHFSNESDFTTLSNQVTTFTAVDTPIVPPYVVCDIYLEDVYYKSIFRTAPDSTVDDVSLFVFDVSRDIQEFLQPDIAVITNAEILAAPNMSAKVFCRFRSSNIDKDGFTVEEGTKPVMATKQTPAVSGDGSESNSFFAINAALQHEDTQNLADHLSFYERLSWSDNMRPLSHRMKPIFCPGDSDHFPVVATFNDCQTLDMILHYKLKGQSDFSTVTKSYETACDTFVYGIAINGNQVTISTEDTVPEGYQMFVRYKKQSSDTWITAGTYSAFPFSFYVLGDDIAGDYDMEIYYYCTACDHSAAVPRTFTLDGTVATLAWRGISPFCVQNTLDEDIYIVLDQRNPTSASTFFPNEDHPISLTVEDKCDIYAKFYSDAAHLTPLSVTQTGLNIYVKRRQSNSINTGLTHNNIQEGYIPYTVDAAGTEVLLGNVTLSLDITNYSTYPTVSSHSVTTSVFTPYPTDLLIGGNTGFKGYATLEQYNTTTNAPTGTTKPNDPDDPDYIPPFAEGTTCPSGPAGFRTFYGNKLQIAKVEIRKVPGPVFIYVETVADTDAGGYIFLNAAFANVNEFVTIKAKTLDVTNMTGILKVIVSYTDSDGVNQNANFSIPDNVETPLPQTFQNITNINIANH